MKTDFSGQINGLVPAMVVFLAHQGYSIDSIHYVALRDDGSLTERDSRWRQWGADRLL